MVYQSWGLEDQEPGDDQGPAHCGKIVVLSSVVWAEIVVVCGIAILFDLLFLTC